MISGYQAPGSAVATRVYRGSPQAAAGAFADDAGRMAAAGYYPVAQSYTPGSWGCAAWLVAALLLLLIILPGVLAILYLIINKPAGALTVTYQWRSPGSIATEPLPTQSSIVEQSPPWQPGQEPPGATAAATHWSNTPRGRLLLFGILIAIVVVGSLLALRQPPGAAPAVSPCDRLHAAWGARVDYEKRLADSLTLDDMNDPAKLTEFNNADAATNEAKAAWEAAGCQ